MKNKVQIDWKEVTYIETECPHCGEDVIRSAFECGKGDIIKCLMCQKEFRLG